MGAEPIRLGKTEKRRGKVSGGVVALLIVLGVFVYLSYRPVARLRSEPPASFMEMRKEWSAERRAEEERTAHAYWERALQVVQVKYASGAPLPVEPPAEFKIEKKGGLPSTPGASSAVRALYWQRLRIIWISPQAWEESYQWSTAWLPENLVAFEQAVLRFVNGVLGQFGR